MNKTQRIFINSDNKDTDKHIKVKLEQKIKALEFLSMSIDTNDVYQSFNSDYGVLVGRVLANNSIGIPNAKLSIFIPLSDTDSNNPNIYSLYPYNTPRDVNNEGKRYNLLPRVGKISDGTARPPQPFGSLPIKEEIAVNEEFLNVYKKYYKYTATTNNAGDYMIFGVPIGTQTVHMSVDITDIGKYSMSPASMIKSLGYSENLFINQIIIKPSNDLNDLPHIETQEIGVDIIPFWGDITNFEIGITRQDFKIRSVIANTFTLFGSVFTDGDGSMWGNDIDTGHYHMGELYRAINDANKTISIATKRSLNVTEKIYCYPPDISDADIDNQTTDPKDNMIVLDKSEYSIYKKNGDFAIIVNCNRNKIISDEFGNDIAVSNDYSGGVFTKFRGFLTLEINEPMNFNSDFGGKSKIMPYRIILKFPQYADEGNSFYMPTIGGDGKNVENTNTINWRKLHYNFEAGKFYSLARFHEVYNKDNEKNYLYNRDPFWSPGVIATSQIDSNNTIDNIKFQFPSNSTTNSGKLSVFGGNWLNFSIYLPQFGYVTQEYSRISYVRTINNFQQQSSFNHDFPPNYYWNEDNNQDIAAGQVNTKWFARSDFNWTDIIEVPITDIQTFKSVPTKGFKNSDIISLSLTGQNKTYTDSKYRNGVNNPSNWSVTPCPVNGGKVNGDPSSGTDTKTYFYKGIGDADCINYLFDLGLITKI